MKTLALHLVLIATFGVLLPWRKGSDFLDPMMISAYACLGVLLAAPYASSLFAVSRPQTMKEMFWRAARAVFYGVGLTLIILLAGILTVNVARGGRLRAPQLDVLGESLAFGLSATIASTLIAAWLTLRFSLLTARRGMRVVFLLAVFAFFYWPSRLAEISLPGGGVALVIAAATWPLLRREVVPQ